jgi:uncharacterized protein (DUF1501 family)
MQSFNRRDFLKAAVGSSLALGTAGWSNASQAALPGYRALVCVFLYGGNDSFNMVVPRSDAEYNVYANSRQNLAVAQDALLPITPLGSDGTDYGFHPSMAAAQELFESGRLAVIGNVGPLVRPVSKQQVLDKSAELPPQLFSHNDQQDQWQTLRGRNPVQTGWAGRIADLLQADTSGQMLPLNVSLSGIARLQAAAQSPPYALGAGGAVEYAALAAGVPGGALRRAAFEALLDAGSPSPYGRALNEVHRRALDTAGLVNAALDSAPVLASVFPGSNLGQQLETVARLIAVRERLSICRQLYFVSAGGFDTHDDQNELQPTLLADVADSLAAFQSGLEEVGADGLVTTFTMSDFGRTLTSNGDGTDHGWGGHQLVMGAAVSGRRIFGTMPQLAIDGPDDVDEGRILPTTSVDQYAATLARWFGLDENQIDIVAPNLVNFPRRDLGFLA